MIDPDQKIRSAAGIVQSTAAGTDRRIRACAREYQEPVALDSDQRIHTRGAGAAARNLAKAHAALPTPNPVPSPAPALPPARKPAAARPAPVYLTGFGAAPRPTRQPLPAPHAVPPRQLATTAAAQFHSPEAPLLRPGPLAYWDFRDHLAGDIRRKQVHPSLEQIVEHAHRVYGLDQAEAVEWAERFMGHLQRDLARKSPAAGSTKQRRPSW